MSVTATETKAPQPVKVFFSRNTALVWFEMSVLEMLQRTCLDLGKKRVPLRAGKPELFPQSHVQEQGWGSCAWKVVMLGFLCNAVILNKH